MKNVLVTAMWAAAAFASDAMPVAQQNAMVQKYCAVCHTDAHPNGRLSLEHFDAAHAESGVAAMIVSKLKAQALGASGQPLPDKATQGAFLNSVMSESMAADKWRVNRTPPLVTASIVLGTPSADFPDNPDLYRLILTCQAETHEGGMELAWSPATPKNGQVFSAAADGNPAVTYKVQGTEKMGNGQAGTSGPGAILLDPSKLPRRTLTISNVLPNETVVFHLNELDKNARKSLAACFAHKKRQ